VPYTPIVPFSLSDNNCSKTSSKKNAARNIIPSCGYDSLKHWE
jgi:hypothetical protein